jgi:uncharacterized membrane protein
MGYLLTLALVLRLVFINQSLWLDEGIEALALMGRQGPLLFYAVADYQPPLYHFIGYAVTHLLGYSEFVLRLPSLISGVATVYFVYKIGEYLGGQKTAKIAGLLAATNPLLIYYAGEGRTYAMTAFFVTASFYYFLQLLKSPSTKLYILYAMFTVLFLWTSYLSWFLLLALSIYALLKKNYRLFTVQVISALTLLAWLPSFITSLGVGQYTRSLSAAWGMVVGGLTWKSLPLTWVKFAIGRISFDSNYLYAAIVLLLAALHFLILRQVKKDQNSKLLLLWLITPIVLGLLTASILPVYSYFRVLFVLPAYLLILSLGLRHLPKIFTSALIALNMIFLTISWTTPNFRHEDWKSLTRDILSETSSPVIAMPSHEQNPGLLYYGIQESMIIEPKKDPLVGDKIYYVRYAEDLFDGEGGGRANLEKAGYTITKQKVYPGIALDIYENSN